MSVFLGQSNDDFHYNIQEIKIKAEETKTSGNFDLAIIFTEEDIKFNDETKPMYCFSSGQPFKPEQLSKEHNFGLVGWEKETKAPELSFDHLQVYNQETCDEKYDIQGTVCVGSKGSKVRFLAIILTANIFESGPTPTP